MFTTSHRTERPTRNVVVRGERLTIRVRRAGRATDRTRAIAESWAAAR